MASIKFRPLAAALLVTLSACGGGGGEAPPSPACTPLATVKVQLFGDSTQYGLDGTTGMLANPSPKQDLQIAMDAQFGLGVVAVEERARSGTDTQRLLDGTDFVNLPWPQSTTGDIIVMNHGINDAARRSVADYTANLRKLAMPRMILETPSPQVGDDMNVDPTLAPYVAAMRAVALERGLPVADVNAYVQSLPNWQSHYAAPADQTHPDTELYRLIVTNVLAPAVGKQVAALRCQ